MLIEVITHSNEKTKRALELLKGMGFTDFGQPMTECEAAATSMVDSAICAEFVGHLSEDQMFAKLGRMVSMGHCIVEHTAPGSFEIEYTNA